MSAPVFVAGTGQLAHDVVTLTGPEGRHAATVRRLEVGERVRLTDGLGLVADCQVVAVGKGEVELAVLERHAVAAPEPRLVVVQALPKGDRGELAVELMTEAGVDEVVPWAAERCVTQWRGERADKALARWRATALSAAKQSRRAWHPVVAPLATTAQVAARVAAATVAGVLHEEATTPLRELPLPASGEVVLVVGPEGGITDRELEALASKALRLGPEVVRTSTAGALAAAALLASSARWA